MAGAWISAWSATSLSRVPAYPFRLSTCAAASRIRSLVRADLEPASSAATSCFLGTSRIIGAPLFPARRPPSPPPRARLGFRCSDPVLATLPRRPQPAWRRRQGRRRLPSNRKHERAQRASGRRRPTWRTDTGSGLTGILLTQRMATSPVPTELTRDFWAAGYAAIDG